MYAWFSRESELFEQFLAGLCAVETTQTKRFADIIGPSGSQMRKCSGTCETPAGLVASSAEYSVGGRQEKGHRCRQYISLSRRNFMLSAVLLGLGGGQRPAGSVSQYKGSVLEDEHEAALFDEFGDTLTV